ncbi:acyl-CoA dehydrogenase, partial [Escherichia coli]|nr:acyl-CoA dehydrogenase [Escherichia coli]
QGATMWLAQNGFKNPNYVGAGAYPYMQLTGTVALGLMWLRMARAAADALAAGGGDASFYEAKLVTARFYAERFLPDASGLRRKIEAGSETV